MSRLQKRWQVLVDVSDYALDFCEDGLVRVRFVLVIKRLKQIQIFASFCGNILNSCRLGGADLLPRFQSRNQTAMFKAICVSSSKSAKATLIQSAVQPVVASDTHKTTARRAFIS